MGFCYEEKKNWTNEGYTTVRDGNPQTTKLRMNVAPKNQSCRISNENVIPPSGYERGRRSPLGLPLLSKATNSRSCSSVDFLLSCGGSLFRPRLFLPLSLSSSSLPSPPLPFPCPEEPCLLSDESFESSPPPPPPPPPPDFPREPASEPALAFSPCPA